MLTRLRDLFAFGLTQRGTDGITRKPDWRTTKQQWVLSVYGIEKVQAVAAMVWPWLGQVKRAQYRRALERCLSK